MEFGERTRDCCLSAAGKERLHLGMTSRRHLGVFLKLRHQCGFSHEVQRGTQGAFRVVPGKSDFHSSCEGKHSIGLES